MLNPVKTFALSSIFWGLSACSTQSQITSDSILITSIPDSAKASTFRPERLFLQQITDHSAIIKWRGDADSACITIKNDKQRCLSAQHTNANHKEVLFDQLEADRDYRYSIGDYSDPSLHFRTAPTTGSTNQEGNIRLWILGDSGTASEMDKEGNLTHPNEAQAVMDGFVRFNQKQQNPYLHLILLLGDNAYREGTDQQWQISVFDLYRPLLSQTALWPTIGNHEMGTEVLDIPGQGRYTGGGYSINDSSLSYYSVDNTKRRQMPYLDIFSLPTNAQAGGIASGTEQYYSANYGNLHIVSLDSQLSTRNPTQRRAMRDWLISDLSSNQQDWTIVIFHHPPYSKSSHDTDTEPASRFNFDVPSIYIREEFTAIFEDYGVDLVYSGHSHAYERSYYLHGHRGDAATFSAQQHAELNNKGEPASGRDNEHYQQISLSSGVDDKVVYTVAGSAGKVSLGKGKLDHPAHATQPLDPQQRHGLAELGSVVVDASKKQLTARFINQYGDVHDQVSIHR